MDKDLSDHDRLIRIDVKVHAFDKWMSNHSKHHWIVESGLLLTVLGLITKLLMGG